MEAHTAEGTAAGRTGRPPAVYALLVGLAFLALTALYGGLALVTAPDGSLVDAVVPVDLTHLEGTPFGDYTVPGIVLLVALGLFPLVVVSGLVVRATWAWRASVLAGVVLLVWLAVEVALIGYVSVLQPVYAVFALVLLGLAFAPSVRGYCRAGG